MSNYFSQFRPDKVNIFIENVTLDSVEKVEGLLLTALRQEYEVNITRIDVRKVRFGRENKVTKLTEAEIVKK